jgi:DNA-binding HxlR family transcriptional regulator
MGGGRDGQGKPPILTSLSILSTLSVSIPRKLEKTKNEMARTSPYAQNCPIARTLDVIGDRWTLLIIRDLFLGYTRFGEFRRSKPGISPKLLSERLKRLEDEGLVERALLDGRPPRAEYRLTPKGRAIFPVLFAIGTWGFEYLFAEEPELRAEVDAFLRSKVPEYAMMSATTTEGAN